MALEHPLLLFWSAKIWTLNLGYPCLHPSPRQIWPPFSFFFGPCSAQFAFYLQQFFFRVLSCKGASLPSYFSEFIRPRFIQLLQSFLCTCAHQLLQCIRPHVFSCYSWWACQTGKFLVSTCCLFWDAQVSQMLWCFPLLPLQVLVPCRSSDYWWFVPTCSYLGLVEIHCHLGFYGCFPWSFNFAIVVALCGTFRGIWED